MSKILIIDDDKDLQDMIRLVLEEKGFSVVSAYGPEEGLGMVRSEKPDLIILDVLMPDNFEGFDVARTIREQLKLRELPIILLTAVHVEKKVPYRFAPHEEYLPVDYFFDKPVQPEVLVAKVKELLNIQ
ncbi:MAG: response regulator [Spirochaetes bacterium]|nr:response regulator [Spirochaetota bacterium]